MPAFPDIQLPDLGGFSEQIVDPVIRTPTEAGYVQTRPQYTRERHVWVLPWEETPLTNADYLLLKAFFSTVYAGAVVFSWTHPWTHVVYNVRFREIGEFVLVSIGNVAGWRGRVTLEEV